MAVGTCQAIGCGKATSPRTRMFCATHTAALPPETQTAVSNSYKRGTSQSVALPVFEEINRSHILIDIPTVLADLTRL